MNCCKDNINSTYKINLIVGTTIGGGLSQP